MQVMAGSGIYEGRAFAMLIIADLLAVLSFAIACFALDYTVGRNSKAKK